MIKITIENKKYEMPSGYSELTLGKFMEITSIIEKQNEYTSPTKYTIDLLSKTMDCPTETLLQLDMDDLSTLLKELEWLKKTPKKKRTTKFKIDGTQYGLIQNKKITTGEMISIESFHKNDIHNNSNIHLIMAILFRPIQDGKIIPLEDDYEAVLERANLFKEKLIIEEVYGCLVNFTNGGRGSTTKSSAASSNLKIER